MDQTPGPQDPGAPGSPPPWGSVPPTGGPLPPPPRPPPLPPPQRPGGGRGRLRAGLPPGGGPGLDPAGLRGPHLPRRPGRGPLPGRVGGDAGCRQSSDRRPDPAAAGTPPLPPPRRSGGGRGRLGVGRSPGRGPDLGPAGLRGARLLRRPRRPPLHRRVGGDAGDRWPASGLGGGTSARPRPGTGRADHRRRRLPHRSGARPGRQLQLLRLRADLGCRPDRHRPALPARQLVAGGTPRRIRGGIARFRPRPRPGVRRARVRSRRHPPRTLRSGPGPGAVRVRLVLLPSPARCHPCRLHGLQPRLPTPPTPRPRTPPTRPSPPTPRAPTLPPTRDPRSVRRPRGPVPPLRRGASRSGPSASAAWSSPSASPSSCRASA